MLPEWWHVCLVAQQSTDITWPCFPAYGAIFSERDSHFKVGYTMVDFYNKHIIMEGCKG